MADTGTPSLTIGRISTQLIKLTIPMIAGMMSMVVFNLTDAFFIGQLGKNQLAAMSFTFPVVMILAGISVGIGMGTSAVISTEIGRGILKNVRLLATNSLLLGFPVIALFAILGELTIEPLFRLMGAEGVILSFIKQYMRIWYIGVPFVVIPMIGNNIIRATGDMKTPGMIMVAIAGFNILIDPILIFGLGPFPAMGIEGGALATVFSRAMGMVLTLTILIKREKILRFAVPKFRELIDSWGRILFIAIPAGLSKIILPLSMGIITRFVSEFGISAVAGFGVACRLEALVMMLLMALSSVLIPFTGQNIGAGRKDRILKALKLSYSFSLAWSAFMFILFLYTGVFFAGLFNRDPKVISTVVLYLNIVAVSLGFQGIMLISSAVLNGSNKPIPAVALSICRMLVFYIPLAIAGSSLLGLKGIFLAGSIANFGAGLLSLYFIYRYIVCKRENE